MMKSTMPLRRASPESSRIVFAASFAALLVRFSARNGPFGSAEFEQIGSGDGLIKRPEIAPCYIRADMVRPARPPDSANSDSRAAR